MVTALHWPEFNTEHPARGPVTVPGPGAAEPSVCPRHAIVRFGSGEYGGRAGMHQSSEHGLGAMPTRNLLPPGGNHPADGAITYFKAPVDGFHRTRGNRSTAERFYQNI